jgi:hypothetical protein
MKRRRAKDTPKSARESNRLAVEALAGKPPYSVDLGPDPLEKAKVTRRGSFERLQKMLARRDRKFAKLREKAVKRFGTFTSWERDGMSGGRWTPPAPDKPRRKPDAKTLEILDKCSKLKGLPLTKQLSQYHRKWSEKRLRAWWANLKSRHKKYIPSN